MNHKEKTMAKSKTDQIDEIQAENEAAQAVEAEAPESTESEPDTEIEAIEAGDSQAPAKVTKAGPKSRKALEEAEAEAARKEAAQQPKANEPKPAVRQKPNPLKQHGKKYRQVAELVENRQYELAEAITLAKKTVAVKFVPSLELHVNLGIDPRQADQIVRSNVVLPAGTGKSIRIAVLASSAKQAEAKAAGADVVGDDDLIAKIEKGVIDFDKLIATPDVMPKLGKLAKILGPKGLMPNPKSGSVTTDVARAVNEAKAGKIEFRNDKQGIVHLAFGKADFSDADLLTNVKTLVNAIMKAKPAGAKGTYVKAISLTTSMGPGIKLNIPKTIAEANPRK